MSKNEWKKWVGVVGRMLLAYALVFAQGAWATQNQATKDKPASPQKGATQQATDKQSSVATSTKAQSKQAQGEESERAVAEEKSSDGRHEGIKVHGHWTIDVRNPDGKLVTHREFENSLQASGATLLPSILLGSQTQGVWVVVVDGAGGTGGPCPPNLSSTLSSFYTNKTDCEIFDKRLPPLTLSANIFQTLTISNSGTGQLVFSGSAIAGQSGAVVNVSTWNLVCPNTTTPSACSTTFAANGSAQFTAATLSSAQVVQVIAGQTIAVTVSITFS